MDYKITDKMKRLLSFLLILVVIRGFPSLAEDFKVRSPENHWLYISVLDQKSRMCEVSRFERNGNLLLTIPSAVHNGPEYYTVAAIGDEAFKDAEIAYVTLPSTLVCIGDYAFENSWLKEISIPNSVKRIGIHAFYNCKDLASATLPEALDTIPDGIFSNTKLSHITIPASVTHIGAYAFHFCHFKEITLPPSLKSIGYGAFVGNSIERVAVPESMTAIGDGAFMECRSLKHIEIPRSVTGIGEQAFSRCGFETFTWPGWIPDIQSATFSYCSKLHSITLPETVTSIGSMAFMGCSSLTSVFIPSGVTDLSPSAFANCPALKDINIGEGGHYVMDDGVLYNLDRSLLMRYPQSRSGHFVIPESVREIGECAFFACGKLTSATLPASLSSIGDWAFSNSGIEEIEFPGSIRHIGTHAFRGCDRLTLTRPELPPLLDSIFTETFSGCRSLGEVTLPPSLRYIGREAFHNCTSLTLSRPELPQTLDSIGRWAFMRCESIGKVVIPPAITQLNNSEFEGCRSLVEVLLPPTLTSIGDAVFNDCRSLVEVNLPSSLRRIGSYAFSDCSLTEIELPQSLESIGSGAFFRCPVTRVSLPPSLRNLSYHIWGDTLREVVINGWYDRVDVPFHFIDGITDIHYLAPALQPDSDVIDWGFEPEVFENAVLHILPSAADEVADHPYWSRFIHISIIDPDSGIGEFPQIGPEESPDNTREIYTLSGNRLTGDPHKLHPGIYIIRQGNVSKKVRIP